MSLEALGAAETDQIPLTRIRDVAAFDEIPDSGHRSVAWRRDPGLDAQPPFQPIRLALDLVDFVVETDGFDFHGLDQCDPESSERVGGHSSTHLPILS